MKSKLSLAGALLFGALALHAPAADLWTHDNLHAWCIVPFDAKHRNSEDRAAMLERLGIKHFAYDWRQPDVPTFDAEMDAIQRHHIDLVAVWWNEGDDNQKLLDSLKRHNLHPQLWVMVSGEPGTDGPQKALDDLAQKFKKLDATAAQYGCALEIYPHDGWAGSPDTDLALLDRLKQLGVTDVGFVYNFNHAQADIAQFSQIWPRLKPFVKVVNLNGMVEQGPRVLYLSAGDKELGMMQVIQQSGWQGPVGIISEQGDKDAEVVLKNNLTGLDWLVAEMNKPGSGGPRPFPVGQNPVVVNSPAAPAPATFVPALHDQEALDASVGGVTVPNRDELRNPPITVECWGRLHDAQSYNILVTSDTKASSHHWELYTTQGDGMFGVFLPGMGGDYRSTTHVVDEKWHYFAAQIEPTRLRLYVDGKLVKDTPITVPTAPVVPGDIAIGKLVEGPFGCNGYVQDVRISRGVKDVSQVPLVQLVREADTLEFWPLDGNTQPGTATDIPQFKIIPAATHDQLTPANGWPPPADSTQWTRSNGGSTSDRYVSFNEINKDNVKRLTQAWIYHSGDGSANVQCNPIFVDGLLYVATPGLHLCALDAATGREVWRFAPEVLGNGLQDVPARRGLIYWPGDAQNPPCVLFSIGAWLYALNPKTGKPIAGFGQNGRAPLPGSGSSVPPVLYKYTLILPGFDRDVYACDVRTGAKVWEFNTLPHGSEFGSATWDSDAESHEGCNDWGGQCLDESRGLVYIATGSPKPNFLGMLHPGDNLFGNCVVALDAATGKYRWHFQEVRHDVWDLDIPSGPSLCTVMHDGIKVDALADVTKIGSVLLLDRTTGKPLFPFRLRRALPSTLPGDRAAVYEPDPELPEQVSNQAFSPDDVTNISPSEHDAIMNFMKGTTWGRFTPFIENKPNAYSNIDGGGEWVGCSIDPNGKLYVSVTQRPWFINVHRVAVAAEPTTPEGVAGKQVFLANCAVCHHADRGGNGFAPSLIGLGDRLKLDDVALIIHKGRGGMPPQPQLNDDDIIKLGAYLLAKSDSNAPVQWTFDGYQHLQDPANYPGGKPPWGKLVCVDLNTGHIAWQVPAGEYPELTAKGIPKTGTPTMGGPASTGGGLVFLSGTVDPTIGAYDAANGNELWSGRLPDSGSAPPIIYMCNGHEYVAVCACGGGKIGGPTGDAWVSFALPEAGVHSAASNIPSAVQGAAMLDAYLKALTDKLALSASEQAAIKVACLADGSKLRDILNDPSLSPLEQQRRADEVVSSRNAKIETLLGSDPDRRAVFLAVEKTYHVALLDLASQGGFAGPQTIQQPAVDTSEKD